jgi:hypothetical protein
MNSEIEKYLKYQKFFKNTCMYIFIQFLNFSRFSAKGGGEAGWRMKGGLCVGEEVSGGSMS